MVQIHLEQAGVLVGCGLHFREGRSIQGTFAEVMQTVLSFHFRRTVSPAAGGKWDGTRPVGRRGVYVDRCQEKGCRDKDVPAAWPLSKAPAFAIF